MKTINKFNQSAVSPQVQDWELVNWKNIYAYVKKLRQRIFRAEQLGHKRKLRKLQRLMIRSKANLLLSIKRVTQINKGKKTPGIDGQITLTSKEEYQCSHGDRLGCSSEEVPVMGMERRTRVIQFQE